MWYNRSMGGVTMRDSDPELKDTTVTIRITSAQSQRLWELARKTGRSRSSVLRILLDHALSMPHPDVWLRDPGDEK